MGKTPSGRQMWKAVRDELMLNLYLLPFSTLAPTIYHVYLNPEDFAAIEGVVPRIADQIQRALTTEVEKVNHRLERSGRRILRRLLDRETLPPIEIPSGGWDIRIQADRNGDLDRGHLGIVSTLSMPPQAEYGGTPTTRIVRSVVANGRRTATTTELNSPPATPAPAAARVPTAAVVQDAGERASLTYEDDQGQHVFVMRKDSLSVGRGGNSAWVDVQIATTSRVSREHFRLRRDPSGRFFIQDVSLWGTSLNGEAIPPAIKSDEGVAQPGVERELPPSARIGLADAIVIQFESLSKR